MEADLYLTWAIATEELQRPPTHLKAGDILCGEDGYHLARQNCYPRKDEMALAIIEHEEAVHDAMTIDDLRRWYESKWDDEHPIDRAFRFFKDTEKRLQPVWARMTMDGYDPAIPGALWVDTRPQTEPKPAKGGWFPAWEYAY